MKTGAKIGIVVVVILVLLMCCCVGSAVGWFFVLGPGSYQTARANTLVAAANKNYTTVNNKSGEVDSQLQDLSGNVSDSTDAQTIKKMEDDLLKAESKTQEMLDELSAAEKKLADAKKLRLPDWYIRYLTLLNKRDGAASDGLKAMMSGISETRKLVGSTTYVIDAVNRQMQAQTQVEDAVTKMTAGDFAGAQADIAAADASLAAAETGLNTANETLKSQDIEDLISLNKVSRELLTLLSRFLSAAAAGDISTMTALESQITAKASEIEAESNALGVSNDYATWFESVVKKYETEYDTKMKLANDYDARAKALYNKNAGK